MWRIGSTDHINVHLLIFREFEIGTCRGCKVFMLNQATDKCSQALARVACASFFRLTRVMVML